MGRINRGQFSDLLRRYLGMVGESSVGDELAPEISPGLTLEQERPEWEFLKGSKLMSLGLFVSGAVGFPSAVQIRNPVGSGIVAIVTGIDIDVQTLASVVLGRIQTNTDLATVIGVLPIARDTRYGGTGVRNSAIQTSQSNSEALLLGDVFWQVQLLAGSPYRYQDPFVLTPGWALHLTTTINNIGLNCGWAWLEKRFDPLEQQ